MGILLKNINAVIYKEDQFQISKTDIYIEENKITGIGTMPVGFICDKQINGEKKMVIPGLINCHTHSYMSVFRNCADDLEFGDWLFGNILPLEDKLVPKDAYWGALLSIMEMIKSGTTCFVDMHMFIHKIAQAVEDSGMRAVLSRGLVGSGEDEGGASRILEAEEEMKTWEASERLSFLYGPHAPYTCDDKYLEIVSKHAKENQKGVHIHLSESRFEISQMKENNQCTPIEYVEKTGLFSNQTIAAHCVHLSENDITILQKNKISVATNPASNMKLGNGFAPIPELLKAGVNVCIGTDGAASNNSLNLFHEMSLLALIHKGVKEDAVSVSAQDTLKIATINGAKAIGREAELGTIEVGKIADLVIIDLNNPQLQPVNNMISALSYSANGSEVESVIIDGKFVMEDRKLTFIDENQVYEEINKITNRLELTGGTK